MKNKMPEIKIQWNTQFKRSLIYWKVDMNKYSECSSENTRQKEWKQGQETCWIERKI